ncbi:MAG: accessory gene regulator B family protein [Clostridia bacterium]|nr:accessory gene regulator B family protein [Clostridia bacterium]
MIDKFCDFISAKIKNSVENLDEERELVIDFGVRLIFGELPKIILLFIIGFLLGIGWYTLLMFLLLAPYRSFTGGFHLKTHWGCMITTTLLYIGPIALAKITPMSLPYVKYGIATLIGIMSIVLITKYAPADTENIPILSKKERKNKKIKAYIALVVLLTISLLAPDKIITYMLFYGMFLQNLTITPIAYQLTNSKHGYEVYTEETI